MKIQNQGGYMSLLQEFREKLNQIMDQYEAWFKERNKKIPKKRVAQVRELRLLVNDISKETDELRIQLVACCNQITNGWWKFRIGSASKLKTNLVQILFDSKYSQCAFLQEKIKILEQQLKEKNNPPVIDVDILKSEKLNLLLEKIKKLEEVLALNLKTIESQHNEINLLKTQKKSLFEQNTVLIEENANLRKDSVQEPESPSASLRKKFSFFSGDLKC